MGAKASLLRIVINQQVIRLVTKNRYQTHCKFKNCSRDSFGADFSADRLQLENSCSSNNFGDHR